MSGIGKLPSKGKMMGKTGAKRHMHTPRDAIQGMTRPAIRRLCRRGGVKRINLEVYPEVRGVLKKWLENAVETALCYTAHARRSTLMPVDVVYAMRRLGNPLYGYGG